MSVVNDAIKLVGERLLGVGVLYVDRSLVEELEGVRGKPGGTLDRHQHTDTSRAVVRVGAAAANRRRFRLFRHPKDAHDHPHLWRWVVDHRPGSGPETTTSEAAYRLCLMTGGLVSSPRARRLWFTSLSSVVFACAWPWAAEWTQSDLFKALGRAEPEILTDWLRERGMDPLGEALHEYATTGAGLDEAVRLAAAVKVFAATSTLRRLAKNYADMRQLEWSTRGGGPSSRAALGYLLEHGRGAPWKRSTLCSARSAVVPVPQWSDRAVVLE